MPLTKQIIYIHQDKTTLNKSHQFKNQSSKGLRIRRSTDNLNSAKAAVTFLEVPLVVANSLKKGVVSIGNVLQDHRILEGRKKFLADLLTRASNIKVPCGCEGLTCFDTGIDPEEVINVGEINRFSYPGTGVHVNSEATPY
jgi:hypothetical protein